MAEPMLGAWEVDEPKPHKKKQFSCAHCSEVFAVGDLRCTWISYSGTKDDSANCAFHLRCVPQAAAAGLCHNISCKNVNRTRGLTKAQVEELHAAKNATANQEVPVTPEKPCPANDEEAASSTKTSCDPPVAKCKKASKTKKCSGNEVGKPSKKAKKGPGKDISKDKDGEDSALGVDKTGLLDAAAKEEISIGPGKHLQGIVPANSYIPIKDFVRGVQPKGTAREVFEGEVCGALPKVSRWITWLSTEAQKVATSIVQGGSHGALSPQQVYAIVLYTLDVRMAGGTLEENFYYNLNPALQTRSIDVLQRIEGYLHYFIGALEALPKEPEKVYYRGVPKSAFDMVKKNYYSGKRIHWSGISSISDSEKVSMQFALEEGPANGGDGPGGVVFNITARSGRIIRHLSAIPSESEVLLLPNFRGIVTKGVYRKGKVFRVDILEEAGEAAFVF